MKHDSRLSTCVVYGTSWCPDVSIARRYLDRHGVVYDYLDIDANPAARQSLIDLCGPGWLVPTITFPDGTVLSNPSIKVLAEKLGRPERKRRP